MKTNQIRTRKGYFSELAIVSYHNVCFGKNLKPGGAAEKVEGFRHALIGDLI